MKKQLIKWELYSSSFPQLPYNLVVHGIQSSIMYKTKPLQSYTPYSPFYPAFGIKDPVQLMRAVNTPIFIYHSQ